MSRGVRDLRELICVSRLTSRPDDSPHSEEEGDAECGSTGDSVAPSRQSSASSAASQPPSVRGSDSGLDQSPPASAEGPPEEEVAAAVKSPLRARRQRAKKRAAAAAAAGGDPSRQLPPLQRGPDLSAARVSSNRPLPPPAANPHVDFDPIIACIDSSVVTDWLERATIYAHELNLWCNEGVNFCAFADFWLSSFPEERKNEIVHLEFSVLLDEVAFAFREGRKDGRVKAEDVPALLRALFHEYPERLTAQNGKAFFLDYLDVLSSERSKDYRLLLTDVRLSTRNKTFAQWFLSIRSFALLSTWSAVVGFYRELTKRGNTEAVRPQTACLADIPATSTVASRVMQATTHGMGTLLHYYMITKKIDARKFKDRKGRNIIFLAVVSQQPRILSYLFAKFPTQVEPNARSDTGNTPLHAAVTNGNLEIVKILVEGGANVNLTNPMSDHSTPLHLAVLFGHPNIVNYLLENGANPFAETNGMGAGELAKEFNQSYIFELITRFNEAKISGK